MSQNEEQHGNSRMQQGGRALIVQPGLSWDEPRRVVRMRLMKITNDMKTNVHAALLLIPV